MSGLRVAILDYGMGNLRSVQKALELLGARAWVAQKPEEAAEAEALVLPGVGAFGDAMANLRRLGFADCILEAVQKGLALLGICVGMQVLFQESEEQGQHQGLGLLRGRVTRFPPGLRVPHVGWNQLHIRRQHPLLSSLPDGCYVYFTHSYHPVPADEQVVLATTDYGHEFASVVGHERIYGVQFHPEKSWRVGLTVLNNFLKLV
jgi:glutamine amidotransferase